jgi:uncharacterized membrane protein YuzA (DUF378 family)
MYTYFWIHKIATILTIIGALNWGFVGAFNFNPVHHLLKHFPRLEKFIYIIVGIAAISIMFFRDTYLPFLGTTVFPTGILQETSPKNSDNQFKINIKPNTQIIYWAAKPSSSTPVSNPWKAYDTYENAGITTSDKNGLATINIETPAAYKIPSGITLKKHIHYRTVTEAGLLSNIKTIFI